MKLGQVAGAAGFVLVLGACEVHMGTGAGSGPPPPTPGPAPVAARAPTPIPAKPGAPSAQHPAGLAPPPAPPPPARHVVLHLARVVHPPPLETPAQQLDVHALRLRIRPGRKCGPRESTPGHWIHIDCAAYTALTTAKPYTGRKIRLMLSGGLHLDDPVRAPPDAVDHRNDGTEGPVKDQGQVGSCTAFSLSSAMDNAIRRQNKPDTMSSQHIWAHYGRSDMKAAGDGNVNKGIADWDTWPYDQRIACELDTTGDGDCGPYLPPVIPGSGGIDPQVQAKLKEADAKGHWLVSEYDELPKDPDAIANELATGADVWFSMNIGSTWMTLNGDTVADWSMEQVEGGHAVLFSGYRHKNGQRQFLVHNSWGKDWGDGGYAWISENAVKQYIKHAYKVVVLQPNAAPTPVSDPSALTDDDCGEDQLVDSVSGQCAQMCPDDSRPTNGQCDASAAAKRRR